MSTALELIARHPFLDGLAAVEAERLYIWASRALLTKIHENLESTKPVS